MTTVACFETHHLFPEIKQSKLEQTQLSIQFKARSMDTGWT